MNDSILQQALARAVDADLSWQSYFSVLGGWAAQE